MAQLSAIGEYILQAIIYAILSAIAGIIASNINNIFLHINVRMKIINAIFNATKVKGTTLQDIRNSVLSEEFFATLFYSIPYYLLSKSLLSEVNLLDKYSIILTITLVIIYYLLYVPFLKGFLRVVKFQPDISDILKDLVLIDSPRSSIFYTFYFFTFLLPVTNLANKIGVSLLFAAVIIAIGIGILIHTLYTALSDLGIIKRDKAQASKPDLETLIFSKSRQSVWLIVYSDSGTTLGGWIISMGRELVLHNGKSEVHIPWNQIKLFEIIVT